MSVVEAAQHVILYQGSPSKLTEDIRTRHWGTLTFKGKVEGDMVAKGNGHKEKSAGP